MLRMRAKPARTYVLERDEAAYDSRVELWLAGFGAQRAITHEEIVTAIDRVPNGHLEGLRGIVYDPECATHELSPCPERWGFNVKGAFFQVERCIVVYDFDSKARFKHILYHEIGHYVFQYVLNGTLRKHWVTRLHPGSRYVSSIARRNANEDFAECYALFLQGPRKLLTAPEKHAYMRELFSHAGSTRRARPA